MFAERVVYIYLGGFAEGCFDRDIAFLFVRLFYTLLLLILTISIPPTSQPYINQQIIISSNHIIKIPSNPTIFGKALPEKSMFTSDGYRPEF